MRVYEPRFTKQFEKTINSTKKKHNERVRAAKAGVDKILHHPELNDGPLRGPLAGKRKLRLGNFRIIFAMCAECRQTGHVQANDCEFCNETDDRTIVFFDVDLRRKVYE